MAMLFTKMRFPGQACSTPLDMEYFFFAILPSEAAPLQI